jgi:hypothetical protein
MMEALETAFAAAQVERSFSVDWHKLGMFLII